MTLILTDGTTFSNAAVKHVDTFLYSRKFSTTGWMTTVLPVALKYSDWSNKFEIANITGISPKLDSNGKVLSFTMSKSILKEGATTNPNLPYLIRAKVANTTTALTIKKTNCDVYPSVPKELTFTSGDYKFIVKGTYEKITSNSIYISSKEVWSPGSSVGPFRAFVAVIKDEPVPTPLPIDPEPSTPTSYEQSFEYVTAKYLELNTAINGIWVVLGESIPNKFGTVEEAITSLLLQCSSLASIQGAISNLEGDVASINLRISDIQVRLTNLENRQPSSLSEGGSYNSQYESRISALESLLGDISIEVID